MSHPGTRPLAAIVDGYSTGNFLPPAFDRLGVDVIHVQSTDELMPSMLGPSMADYTGNLVCADAAAVDGTVAELARLGVVAVLAGQEPGVPLADLLSERLGLATNGSAQSLARRDKHAMIEAVAAAGLRCARQLRTADPDEAVAWAVAQGFPAVVKPLSSASTDNVYVCAGPDEVRTAAERVLSSSDIFDLPNHELLVQTYLAGTEYIVDTVGVGGAHFVCGVWRYEKSTTADGKPIYDKDVLCAADEEPVPRLIEYTLAALDALGVRNGPVHAEVIMTPEGPALVEMGARLNGNMNPGFHDTCLGTNQADLIALAYADPAAFTERHAGRAYTKRQAAIVHNTATSLSGEVREVDQAAVDKINSLSSVYFTSVKLAPGKGLRATVDLLSSPLRIFMTAPDEDRIRADCETIRAVKDEVYVLRG